MQELLAEVNSRIRELAERESHGAGESGFHRECGVTGCSELVSLSLEEYESARDALLPILAEGHLQSKTAAAQTRAARLQHD